MCKLTTILYDVNMQRAAYILVQLITNLIPFDYIIIVRILSFNMYKNIFCSIDYFTFILSPKILYVFLRLFQRKIVRIQSFCLRRTGSVGCLQFFVLLQFTIEFPRRDLEDKLPDFLWV